MEAGAYHTVLLAAVGVLVWAPGVACCTVVGVEAHSHIAAVEARANRTLGVDIVAEEERRCTRTVVAEEAGRSLGVGTAEGEDNHYCRSSGAEDRAGCGSLDPGRKTWRMMSVLEEVYQEYQEYMCRWSRI